MIIEKLDWDTEFFGYHTGAVVVKNSKDFDFNCFKTDSDQYRLVYIFSDDNLNFNELNLIDTKLTFRKKCENIEMSHSNNLCFYDKNRDDFESLEALALESGIYSRFNLDKNFKNNEYRSLYKQWIKNVVHENESQEIIVYKERGRILGFTTIKEIDKSLCDISLVAVDGEFRGRSIGTKLINFTIKQGFYRNYKNIQVVTQSINEAAINLYLKCGFKLYKTQYVFHYWNL